MSSKPKHILITRFPFESILSGEEWHTINLAEGLRKKGYEVSFMGSDSVLLQEFEQRGFTTRASWAGPLPVSARNVLLFTLALPVAFVRFFWDFAALSRKRRIDTIYMLSLSEKVMATPLLRLLRKRILWVEHQRFGRWMYQNPYRLCYELWSRIVHVVGVSPMYKELLTRLRIPKDRLHIITNGINLDLFHPKIQPLPFHKDEIHIGTIARLYEDKGIHVLLDAVAEIAKKHKKITCHIMGEGPLLHDLKKQAKELGIDQRVRFLTPYKDVPRDDIPRFLKALDAFVLPSTKMDPFGLVVAEAMAVGTPTIASTACGITTYLHHEKDALLIPPEDSGMLAEALFELIENPKKAVRIGRAGSLTARQQFSEERMISEYESYL